MGVGVKLRDAIEKSNTSDLAGQVQKARDLERARLITEGDLLLVLHIQELGSGNSWNDAKKVLDEAMKTE